MQAHIEVKGWESAQAIVKQLLENGYETLITTDGQILEDGQLSYMITFVHPKWSGEYFEIVQDDYVDSQLNGTRKWDDIKKEIDDLEPAVTDGLEHLDEECQDYKINPNETKIEPVTIKVKNSKKK